MEQWSLEKLPAYLKMNFRVVNSAKKVLAESTDLLALQQKFTKQSMPVSTRHELERKSIKTWDFDALPETVLQKSQGLSLQLFPALVDEQDSVSIQMFAQQKQADDAMRKGVRRLLMLSMYQQVKMLNQDMQKMKAMMMQAALLGDPESLRKHVIEQSFEKVFLLNHVPRNKTSFERCLSQGRAQLMREGKAMIKHVDAALQAYGRLMGIVNASVAAQKKGMLDDVKQQCSALIYDGFVAKTPLNWLRHLPRFLDAACIRVEKSSRDLKKDQRMAEQVDVFWQYYQQHCKAAASTNVHNQALEEFRWMIEELRVSLFAQELKTSMPISVKRLEKHWQRLR